MARSKFRRGDWVEVLSREEVLRTLDADGCIDRLPFMPEMLEYCGQRLQVFKSAHKTCDTVNQTGGRALPDSVHLEGVRCNGSAHGDCQASCLIFWRSGWLKPADGPSPSGGDTAKCTEETLRAAARRDGPDGEPLYSCQATQLCEYTTPLPRTVMSQYVEDVTSGNVGFVEALKIMFLAGVFNLRYLGRGYSLWSWLYNRMHQVVRGCPSPYGAGDIAVGKSTPHEKAGLQIGEIVEVKSHDEILKTLNVRSRNRGLSFDKEMVRYCGKRFRVANRVHQIVDEKTGKIVRFSNACIVLQGAYCTSQYSENRLMCPRYITPYWREIWLRRVEGENGAVESPAGPEGLG